MNNNRTHDFNKSLEIAKEQSKDPMWELAYRAAFSNFQTMTSIEEDGWAQRAGIDRIVTLSSGKTLTFDEKVRTVDYGDILLEYWSDRQKKLKGWVAKDLGCDFIAYAIMPTRKCYLFPFQQLRKAWKENGRNWVNDYRKVIAKNNGYETISVPVPINVLMKSISESLIVSY